MNNKQGQPASQCPSPCPSVFVFSGQGSQTYHMAAQLYQHNELFRQWLDYLDALVKQAQGYSVIAGLYDADCKKSTPFDDVRLTHPAIFMVEYALAQCLIAQGTKPDYVIGASMGELTAAAVSEILTVQDAITLVTQHAQIFAENNSNGGMVAVLADPSIYHHSRLLLDHCDIAAINLDENFIVSGDNNGLKVAENHFKQNHQVYVYLPVRQPFHSRALDPNKADIIASGDAVCFNSPQVPFISCTTSTILKQFTSQHLWDLYRQPIRLKETIDWMENRGNYRYLDLGPGGTFANLIKYNRHFGGTSEIEIYLT